jgi:hypothetical protein
MKQQSALQKMLERQHLLRQLHLHRCHVQVTIHLEQAVRFHVLHALATIHFQQVERFHVHHNVLQVLKELELHVQEWRDHAQVQFAQVLLHVLAHHVQQVAVDLLHVQVAHHLTLHTNQIHQVPQVQLLVVRNVQVVVVHHNVVVQVERLERMQARSQDVNKSHVRLYAMSSTICRHLNLVAQLFLTVMERLQSVCVAVLLWQILQKRSVQIQQH